MKFLKIIIVTLLFLPFVSSHAKDNCKKTYSNYDTTYCLIKEFISTDDELNKEWKELNEKFEIYLEKYPDPNAGTKLSFLNKTKQAQIRWIKYRDKKCANSTSINLGCAIVENDKRIDFFKWMNDSCDKGHCLVAIIPSDSWKGDMKNWGIDTSWLKNLK